MYQGNTNYDQPLYVQPQPGYSGNAGGYQQQQPPQGYYQAPPPQYVQGQPVYDAPPPKPGDYGGYNGVQQQPQQMTTQGVPLYKGCQDPVVNAKFVYQGYKDVWAAILFILTVLLTIGWAIYNGVKYKDRDFKSDGNDNGVVHDLKLYVPLAALAAFILCCIAMIFMRTFPRQYVIGANLLSIIVTIAITIYVIIKVKVYWYAGIMAVLILIQIVWLYLVRHRIPFAGVLLSQSVRTVTKHWGSILTSFCSLGVLCVYLVVFCVMVIPTVNNMNGHSSALNYVACCFFLLLFYWTTQVIINVVHVTASGIVATWYFAGEKNMPPNPSLSSFIRAMTTSFGTICFGSLIVALLKLLHAILRDIARRQDSFLACIAMCFVGIIERLMEYFNVYAFTHVAIYGSSFIQAAKQTWAMIKNFGWAAVFNDNLVYPVLTLTTFFNSLAIGVAFGFGSSSWAVGVITFLTSYVIHMTILRVVYSGIVTIFVCFAENEEVIAQTDPVFSQQVHEAAAIARKSVC